MRIEVHVRTTLVIDDDLLRAARLKAAEQETTLSAIVNSALRQAVSRPILPQEPPFVMITFGTPGNRVLSPGEIASWVDDQETEALRASR